MSQVKSQHYAIFSLSSIKLGYGHYNRINHLISIINDKRKKIIHEPRSLLNY